MYASKQPNRQISFRKTVLLIMSAIALPLFVAVLLFDLYTVQSQKAALRVAHRHTLSVYQSLLEDTTQVVENHLVATGVNDLSFQSIIYARTKTEAYLASKTVSSKCDALLKAYELLGGFFTYSEKFNCYYSTPNAAYSTADHAVIRKAVTAYSGETVAPVSWKPLQLTDRTVFLCVFSAHETVIAAVLDPTLQSYSDLEQGSHIIYTMRDGAPLAASALGSAALPVSDAQDAILQDENGAKYDCIRLPVSAIDGFIVYAIPYESFWNDLSAVQKLLLGLTLLLLAFIPLCRILLRNLLLRPLDILADTMRSIQAGNTDARVPQNSKISEVNAIAQTVNTMLGTIQKQRIEAYERKLEIQNAQLQYLQLQIRPHFFLNCLNLIYSIAGEKKYRVVQDLTLDLSTYLRTIFKDGSKLVPLGSEIGSVESYVRIQGTGAEAPPTLAISMDADAAEQLIPPLSVLTFVENSVKHARRAEKALNIRVRCALLGSAEGEYLNITVSDNGGGFTAEQLRALNEPAGAIYQSEHVGITNIRHRLRLLYGAKAVLSFQNAADGACVEMFLPLHNKEKEGDSV